MMRQLSLVCWALALGSLATNAWADGVPLAHTKLRPCGDGPFAGAYVGAAVGYGQQRAEIRDQQPGSPTFGAKFHNNEGGVTFGGYTGYNWQCDHIVFGVETDFNWLGTSPTAFVDTSSLESKLDWFGTVRGRLGFVAHEDLLLYATGGLAYASVDHTFSDTNVGGAFGPFSQSNTDTKAGWTAGLGAEYMHDCCWLLRAETLFVDLGSETHGYVAAACPLPCQANLRWDDQFWVARLGLTYRFHEREPVVPLK